MSGNYQQLIIAFLFIFCAGSSPRAQHRVVFQLEKIPGYTPRNTGIFLAGSFNDWQPDKDSFSKNEKNTTVMFNLAPGSYEYKVTRGSWQTVECDNKGQSKANRNFVLNSDTIIKINIDGWQDHFSKMEKKHTASKNVRIIERFYMPQLKRYRSLRIYLPRGYKDNATKRYPVLYMQDGQNLFDEYTAFAGEWAVDDFLDSTDLSPCIVVAIDNGGSKRLDEYCPYKTKRIPNAEGAQYARFMVNTLKPFIDKQYRTLKSKQNTFIAGSSMGALISFYTALQYPSVFGGAGILSPSFWVTDDKIYVDIAKKGAKLKTDFFFYAGQQESEAMATDMLKAIEILLKISSSSITAVLKSDGKHNEESWRKEFPGFYKTIVAKTAAKK